METTALVPQILILLVLLVCSAFFSGSETALMAISRIRLRQLRKKHGRRVRVIESILKKPEKLIGTILLGNNLVNVAMSALATAIAISLWGDTGIVYVTGALTVIILIFAETTPKVYARYHSDRISMMSGPVLKVIMTVLGPLVAMVTFISSKLLLLTGIDISRMKREIVSEAEVKTLITISREDGGITEDEKRMLSRVFTLDDKTVRDIMLPGKRMKTLSTGDTIDQALAKIKRLGFSRFPVRDAGNGDITGILHAKDLLGMTGDKTLGSLKGIIRPLFVIPATRKIDSQLRAFKRKRAHQAVVIDEKDMVIGLITLEDILEEMVGSIEDEYDALEPEHAV